MSEQNYLDKFSNEQWVDMTGTTSITMPRNLFQQDKGGKIGLFCICSILMKDRAGTFICNHPTKPCPLRIDKKSLDFMKSHKYFKNIYGESRLKVPICLTCAQSKLFTILKEDWSNYGIPTFTCGCVRGERMYQKCKDVCSSALEYEKIWNNEMIELTSSVVTKGKNTIDGGTNGKEWLKSNLAEFQVEEEEEEGETATPGI